MDVKPATGDIQSQAPMHYLRARPAVCPTNQRTHPRLELGQVKRLAKIVVRAHVEHLHAIWHGVASRDDDDGHRGASRAQAPEHFDTVDPRQPDIQKDQVVGYREQRVVGFLAAVCHIYDMRRLGERQRNGLGQHAVVFNQQYMHVDPGFPGLQQYRRDAKLASQSEASSYLALSLIGA